MASGVEVLRQRNKPSSPCIDGNYDATVVQHAINSAKCKHPGIKLGNATHVCNSTNSYNDFQKALYQLQTTSPCQSIQFLNIKYDERDISRWWCPNNDENRTKNTWTCNHGMMMIYVYFKDHKFKAITNLRAYTIESLIGNTGGYMGTY